MSEYLVSQNSMASSTSVLKDRELSLEDTDGPIDEKLSGRDGERADTFPTIKLVLPETSHEITMNGNTYGIRVEEAPRQYPYGAKAVAFNKASDFCNASTIRLKITTEESLQAFLIHENILCDASPVMKAALQGGFLESKSNVLKIDNVSIETMNDLVNWLYSRARLIYSPDLDGPESWNMFYSRLALLYIVACKYMISDLIAAIEYDIAAAMDTAMRFLDVRCMLNTSVATMIYENTPATSQFRKLIAALEVVYAQCQSDDSEKCQECASMCPEYAADLLSKSIIRTKAGRNLCYIHELLGRKSSNH
ncbi:uncharacterized protein KY384_008615 [Bacidia gigantensis]|uniref:uncharacterized protein n=1 Tax=Bacidia gigantensis TaxID=2732470 RepID=UPI001D04CECE|nr:uncharacterized protein KY384_008615 [Bacidia gigantensis]KAG8527185.1 hypothetical protein KY384_008615 [Bacidia gigantensis]